MRSMIQDSLRETRDIGGRLIEIERIRYRLRRANAPWETFQDLDRRHRAELNLLKTYRKQFNIGIALTFFLVVFRIFSGVVAMVFLKDENLTVGLIMTTCSVSALYLGKKEILG